MSKENNAWIIREGFNELRENFPNRCNDCNPCVVDIHEQQFAHREPTRLSGRGRGKINRYYDIRNNPDAYLLCCKQKHKEIDDS